MLTLFTELSIAPPGFIYVPDFITEQEEQSLLDSIARLTLENLNFQGYEAKRKVINFGYDWSFVHRRLSKGKDIPIDFMWLVDRTARYTRLNADDIAEVLITEYPPESVINWHRDAPPFDLIAGISLLSDCTFRLRPYDKTKRSRKSILSIPIKRRSLYIMKGEARSDWEHSIPAMKSTRYSITLRTLRESR
jgi:alkylated DNA repair dioxygenase AlkB